ncbi:MAG TPA: helix-turn-helix transcriptional regulator [Tepidisphaeraceae bacterium]
MLRIVMSDSRQDALPEHELVSALIRGRKIEATTGTVFIAYDEFPTLTLKGFLVAARKNLHNPIAFVPILVALAHPHRRDDVSVALTTAFKIAVNHQSFTRRPGVCWLRHHGRGNLEIPGWIYGLKCLEIGSSASVKLESPRPVCPVFLTSVLSQVAGQDWLRYWAQSPTPTKISCGVSGRPREVLDYLQGGLSEKQISNILGLSRHTIHCHVKQIYRKFGVTSRAELLSRFISARSRKSRQIA